MHFVKALLLCCWLPTLAVAADAVAPAAVGAAPQATKEQRFESWGLTCAVARDEKGDPSERCMISQVVATDRAQTKVVLGITIDYLDSPSVPTVRFRFSSAAKASAGIGVKIDNQPDMRLAITGCNPERCESVGRMAAPVLKLWRGGKRGQMAFLFQNGKQVLIPFSLSGFRPALSALERAVKASGKNAGGAKK